MKIVEPIIHFANVLYLVLTIISNASQAIEQNGTIAIKTSSDHENVYVKVSDSGKGIPPEKLGTFFELGFSTKGSKIGMTMGLSNAYSIIQKHGGDIRVESEVAKARSLRLLYLQARPRLLMGKTSSRVTSVGEDSYGGKNSFIMNG